MHYSNWYFFLSRCFIVFIFAGSIYSSPAASQTNSLNTTTVKLKTFVPINFTRISSVPTKNFTTLSPAPTKKDPLSDYPEYVIDYLVKYGYLLEKRLKNLIEIPSDSSNSSYIAYKRSEIVNALLEYQLFMNIAVTGLLSKETLKKIHQKRCGMPDKIPRSSNNVRLKIELTKSGQIKKNQLLDIFKKNKRKSFNNNLNAKIIYWNIYPKPTFSNKHRQNMWHTLEYAFNRWASVTDIVFIRGDYLNFSDIQVGFWKGAHGDNNDFDGVGGVLAHANTQNREIHIDNDEHWGEHPKEMFLWLHPNNGTDLIQVAIHEIGHVLGLSHDSSPESVMNPVLKNFAPLTTYALAQNDMDRVKASFGKCWPDHIDAIWTNKYLDGKTYIIKGPFIYQINDGTIQVEQSWPRATTLDFFSTTFVDEAFWHTDYFLYFFDQERYYIFDTTHDPSVSRAGPYKLHMNTKNIGFRGLKHHKYIDAAMVLQYQGKPTSFIFQDEYVYKWDLVDAGWHRTLIPSEKCAVGWPKKIADVFPGLPHRIDSAFTWPRDGRTYFFKGKYFYIWLPDENKADGLYGTYQWQNICNVYLCMVAPRPKVYNCESWELNKSNCNHYCF